MAVKSEGGIARAAELYRCLDSIHHLYSIINC